MAKGNLFQGMARGKVGDVVFYRMNGWQMSRVRNRRPKNPRTNAQLYQRAIMATVMRAYSAGKVIFDHAFEGVPVNEGCMRKFLSLNADKLRNALITDVRTNNQSEHINAIVNAPKVAMPTPNTYIVAQGSYQQSFLQITEVSQNQPNAYVYSSINTFAAGATSDDIKAAIAEAGIQAGDIFTFVGFTSADLESGAQPVFVTPDNDGQGGLQMPSQFFFVRLIAKDLSNVTLTSSVTFADVFDVVGTANVASLPLMQKSIAALQNIASDLFTFENKDQIPYTLGIIRSREDSKIRSNTELKWLKYDNVTGIDWLNILLAWNSDVDALGGSELILEGGSAMGAPSSSDKNEPTLPGPGGPGGYPVED